VTAPARARSVPPATALFALAILLNAGLLFWLEPLFAKLVLPLLGGAPAVWNTCLVFYQVALLAGYLWAHVGPRLTRGARNHAVLHLVLCAVALVLLPVAVSPAFLPPPIEEPVPWLLTVLVVSIGLPFFLISANGPLLQRWFAGTGSRGARDPYFLYAASNLGSAAALILFPLVLERAFTLSEQGRAWQVAYIVNAVLVLSCAVLAWRSLTTSEAAALGAPDTVSWKRRLRWVALAAVPSSLMLGVTTYISTEIAPIPLVWIVPLALYLGTLVLAFANVPGLNATVRAVFAERLAVKTALITGGTIAASLAVFLLALFAGGMRIAVVVGHLLLFTIAALLCHVQLADNRPSAHRLTEYYFWMGVGGAVGGTFNALVGPRIFTSVLEYPLALAAVLVLLPPTGGRTVRFTIGDLLWPAALGAGAVLLLPLLRLVNVEPAFSPRLLLALPALGCLAFTGRPVRFGLGIAAVVIASTRYPSEIGRVEHADRNFYGVHRVLRDEESGFRWITHGSTVHGGQALSERVNPVPITYFHPTGPLGDIFATFNPSLVGGRVAVIGLGAGSMVAYGRRGQSWTFYEIDPAVVTIARDTRFFTFLLQPRPTVRIVLGDARLALAADSMQRYNMLVLDAFSSDAIPVHLLTREVMRLYLSRLTPDGVIAMHLSNRYLDLAPVAAGLASVSGLRAAQRVDLDAEAVPGKYRSYWVVFARDSAPLLALRRNEGWTPLVDAKGLRPWSDDYSSIVPILRRGEPEGR
jgi:spermidine synthase